MEWNLVSLNLIRHFFKVMGLNLHYLVKHLDLLAKPQLAKQIEFVFHKFQFLTLTFQF